MLHEIEPHRFDNRYQADKKMGEKDFVFHFKGNSLLLKSDGNEIEIPKKEDFPGISEKTEHTFLFTLDDASCFLIWDDLNPNSPGLVYKEINFFRITSRQETAWIMLAGFHLMNWYSQNKFCGKCGERTQQKADERALICPDCGNIVFPKISPAIIVAITCNDKILLARNSNFPGNWYSLIAGYVDIGEPLEETIKREVKEEVGLDIRNIRYYKSQPWPLSGSLMIGYTAQADDTQLISIDAKEITDAAWFQRGNLPDHPQTISIAGEMIQQFEKGKL